MENDIFKEKALEILSNPYAMPETKFISIAELFKTTAYIENAVKDVGCDTNGFKLLGHEVESNIDNLDELNTVEKTTHGEDVSIYYKIPLYTGELSIRFNYGVDSVENDVYHDVDNAGDTELAQACRVDRESDGVLYHGYQISFNLEHENEQITHGIIAHEVSHIVFMILGDRGLEHVDESDEAYAYLTTWVTDKVYGIIQDKRIVIEYK